MKTSEEIKKFILAHPDIVSMSENGWFPASLVKTAVNFNNEYTFDEQQDAFKQIYDIIKSRYAGKDFTASETPEQAEKLFNDFTSMFDNEDVNEDDWQTYDSKQMSKLADKMGYNWKNLDDRSAMMKRLQDKTIRREKVKAYEEDKKNSPVSTFVTEMFAPNITARLSKGEDVKGRDFVLDALNTGTMLVPSVGGKKAAAALLGTDIAQSVGTGFNTGAVDTDFWNDKADLGLAIGFPLVGNAAGKSTELLKKAGDIVKGSLEATPLGGKVLDNVADPILDALEDTKLTARKNAQRDIDEYRKYSKYRRSIDSDIPPSKLDELWFAPYTIEKSNELKHLKDLYTNRTGAAPYDPKDLSRRREQADIAQNALDYLDNSTRFSELTDEQREKATAFLRMSGMQPKGSRGKEVVQDISKSISKPLIEGSGSKHFYRDDAIEEKNERIKKQAEEIVKNKAGAVYNYYKGRPNDLTEEEIEILKAAEVL